MLDPKKSEEKHFILQTPGFRTLIPRFRIRTRKFLPKTLAISFLLLTFASIPQWRAFHLRESNENIDKHFTKIIPT